MLEQDIFDFKNTCVILDLKRIKHCQNQITRTTLLKQTTFCFVFEDY